VSKISRKWTGGEIATLKEKYPKHGSDIPELDRTRTAIQHKAMRLGLKYSPKYMDKGWLREQYWENKKTTREIAEMLGCDPETIRYWMKKHEIRRRTKEEWAQLKPIKPDLEPLPKYMDKEWLKEQYWGEKKSTNEMAEMVDCDPETIRYWMIKYGIRRRTKSEYEKLRRVKPDLSPSKPLSYILGVLLGDGAVRKKGFTLIQNKEEFAESFADAIRSIGLDPKRRVKEYHNNHWGRDKMPEVSAFSVNFCEWFRSLNLDKIEDIVTERKSFIKAFVRGLYESDGCHSTTTGITNTDKDLLEMTRRLIQKIGFSSKIYDRKTSWRGNKDIYQLLIRGGEKKEEEFIRKIDPCIKR